MRMQALDYNHLSSLQMVPLSVRVGGLLGDQRADELAIIAFALLTYLGQVLVLLFQDRCGVVLWFHRRLCVFRALQPQFLF